MRRHEYIREFENGNINFRLSTELLEQIKEGKISQIEAIGWTLDELDCYLVGEEYCIGNALGMAVDVYNAHSDYCYMLVFKDIEEVLMAGKTLKLYAREPDETDRERLREDGWL